MATRKLRVPRPSHKSTLAFRLAYHSKPNEAGCRIWQGAKNPKGYGHIKWQGRVWQAHRLAWTDANGPIPDGLHVCHRCDTPSCVNVEHLFLGTNDDNMADRSAKGRQAFNRGVHNGRAKLTEDDVRAIRADPRVHAAVARDYGVSTTKVSQIRRGVAWRHI